MTVKSSIPRRKFDVVIVGAGGSGKIGRAHV